MIRDLKETDIDDVVSIWLESSIEAHNFIDETFWKSQAENMRRIYIPNSESYVYEYNSRIVGFYSLNGNNLAAIFLLPKFQGRGVGKALLKHAKSKRSQLSLTVYSENIASYKFYLSQGFSVERQQEDPHTGHAEYLMSTA